MSPGITREDKVASLDANHVKAWNVAATMTPNNHMLQYHEAFLNGYLELLLFRQKYASVHVPRAINKTLNEWIHNQRTLIGNYKKNKPDNKFSKYNEMRYINLLNAVGIDWKPKGAN